MICFSPANSSRSQFKSLDSLCLPYTKPPRGQFRAWFTSNILPSASQWVGRFLGILPNRRARESRYSSALIQNSLSVVGKTESQPEHRWSNFLSIVFLRDSEKVSKSESVSLLHNFSFSTFFWIAARIVKSWWERSKFDPPMSAWEIICVASLERLK